MPSQIFEYQGIPLKSSRTLTINLGNQQILSTNLTVEIPTGFYGQVYAPKNLSCFIPHVAPSILIPGHENIFVLIANLYKHNLTVKKGQTVEFLHFHPLVELKSFTEFGNLTEFGIPNTCSVLTMILRSELNKLLQAEQN